MRFRESVVMRFRESIQAKPEFVGRDHRALPVLGGKKQKSRRGRTPEGIPPRRPTD